MKIYHFNGKVSAGASLMASLDAGRSGFSWWLLERSEFENQLADIQTSLQAKVGHHIMHLHVIDICNAQHPSRYDYAYNYEMLIFRSLFFNKPQDDEAAAESTLSRIDSRPVAFVVFEQLLITVYDRDAGFSDEFIARFTQDARLPQSPADLMLRMVNVLVDSYLDLRKPLSQNLKYWQGQLLAPNGNFGKWQALLNDRERLDELQDACEEQHDAMQEWLDAMMDMPQSSQTEGRALHDLLVARSRDIIEHIARVRQHVNRLDASIESAVQIHFSAQAHRTNNIMRVLTAITAIFLPLNLITGFFGMNFDFLPLIHEKRGILYAVAFMLIVAGLMAAIFWRKRYLSRTNTSA